MNQKSTRIVEGTRPGGRSDRPRDAATLIVLREDGADRRVLMGKRHAGHRFMPNMYVFPGGRLDPADCRVAPASPLHPAVEDKLLARMRGRPSRTRARGLAMAAVREAFEEAGLLIGRPADRTPRTSDQGWQAYFNTGHTPELSPLRYIARAITPPGRTRRFDTRFFVVDARHVPNIDTPHDTGSQELLHLEWHTLEEAHSLELPWITREVLRRLEAALAEPGGLEPGRPVTFQHFRGSEWVYETL